MKHTEKNEIDLMLRTLAKRAKDSVAQTQGAPETPVTHLDADELNAYAEQALPPAARALYTAHLVECSVCRKIVSELTASGANVQANTIGEETRTTFWQKVGGWLSPPVLRYAVPVLALLTVLTVGLVALRQRKESPETAYVAQNEAPPSLAGSEAPLASGGAPQEKKPEAIRDERVARDEKPTSESSEKKLSGDKNSEVARTQEDSGLVAGNKPDAAASNVTQPSYAPEPPPAAAPAKSQPSISTSDARKNESVERQQETAKQKEQAVVVDGISREIADAPRAKDEAGEEVAQSKNRKTPSAAGRSGGTVSGVASRRAERDEAKRTDTDAETRSIAGRRFRRQGSLWIDTAYDSSRATITIVRNSEQYRALVADEPGIRTISDQLHGEVVIVWKGRAYRIR
ncbi:MAG: hypothetical protein ABJB97_09070 [Acidobacteriota bacterium]